MFGTIHVLRVLTLSAGVWDFSTEGTGETFECKTNVLKENSRVIKQLMENFNVFLFSFHNVVGIFKFRILFT